MLTAGSLDVESIACGVDVGMVRRVNEFNLVARRNL